MCLLADFLNYYVLVYRILNNRSIISTNDHIINNNIVVRVIETGKFLFKFCLI